MIRRDVLRLGGVMVAGAAMAGGARAIMPTPYPVALFDGRYGDARAFAAAVREAGGTPLDTGGDLATLWQRERRAVAGAGAVAGLTTYADMLMMADIAGAAGLRARFRIMHDARTGGHVSHRVVDGAAVPLLTGAGRFWPEVVSAHAAGLTARNPGFGPSPRSPDHPGTLWSWMFA